MKTIGNQLIYKNYFDSIDSFDKAYILGLIAADGSVYSNKVEISLAEKDLEILEKIKVFLGQAINIKTKVDKRPNRQNTKRIFLYSKYIREVLNTYGLNNNKTFTLKFPNYICNKLIPHFIRGYFDGDGNISIHHQKNRTSPVVAFQLISTEDFCIGCQSYFKTLDIKSSYYKEGNIFRFKIYGIKNNKKVFNILYSQANNLYLSRKYNKFKSLLQY